MPILSRYLLKEFLPSFALCLAFFAGVLLMNQFLRLFNMAVMKGVSPVWIAACFARLLPYFASLAVPMAFLVALLVTLSSLGERGELMALRASGYSFRQMTWPFLALGLALSFTLLYVNHKASPEGFRSFKRRYAQAAAQVSGIDLQPGSFVRLGDWRLFAHELERETGAMKGAYLIRMGGEPVRISANAGSVSLEKGVGAALELRDGQLQLLNQDPAKLTVGRFKRYRVFLPVTGAEPARRDLDIPELPSARLRERLADPGLADERRREYRVELAVRSAGAFSPFVFFWIAAPLGFAAGRKSKGFASSLGVMFAFYGLLAMGIGLGRRHPALSDWSPWLPDIAGMALGLILARRAARQ